MRNDFPFSGKQIFWKTPKSIKTREKIPFYIAGFFDEHKSIEIAWNREFRTWLGKINGEEVIVTSTGIGGSSTSIAVDELAQLGVHTFIRVGTTGAIQKDIDVGDVIITTASVRLDGASIHYCPIEYPAVANYYVLHALVESAKALDTRYHVGITASSDTFYPGQERYDSFSGYRYIIKRLQGSLKEWQQLNVLNYEMESSTLFTIASTLNLRAGCITEVIINRVNQQKINSKITKLAKEKSIKIAIGAMKRLIDNDKTLPNKRVKDGNKRSGR